MPRHAYILPRDINAKDWQCRGGVGSNRDDDNDYVLEIGKMQHCDTRMLALAAHVDEISALFVMLKGDPLAVLIKRSWDGLTEKLNAEFKEAETAEQYLAKQLKEGKKENETE
jgi:hypothetical protein